MSSRCFPRFLFICPPHVCQMPWPDQFAIHLFFHWNGFFHYFSFTSKIFAGCLRWIAFFLLRFLLVGLRGFFSFLFISLLSFNSSRVENRKTYTKNHYIVQYCTYTVPLVLQDPSESVFWACLHIYIYICYDISILARSACPDQPFLPRFRFFCRPGFFSLLCVVSWIFVLDTSAHSAMVSRICVADVCVSCPGRIKCFLTFDLSYLYLTISHVSQVSMLCA